MRTTITLDPDVAERVQAHMQLHHLGFKESINELIRKGLSFSAPPTARVPFRVKARPMGLKQGLSLDNVEELLDQVEGNRRL